MTFIRKEQGGINKMLPPPQGETHTEQEDKDLQALAV